MNSTSSTFATLSQKYPARRTALCASFAALMLAGVTGCGPRTDGTGTTGTGTTSTTTMPAASAASR